MPIDAISISPLAAPGAKPNKDADPKRVLDAARQFESLLLSQMLRSMRESGSQGWMGTGEDQTGASAMELAEEQFAQALSASGGLGLAQMVEASLNRAGKT